MPVYVLDTAFVVEETGGVAAHRVVVRGTSASQCKYPSAAHADNILGVTTESGAAHRSVGVRRLGKALVEAAGAITAGAKVCIADALGRIQAVSRAAVVTGATGNNNAIRWTSRDYSISGNAIVVDIVVSGNNTPLSVSVSGNTITINAATNGSGVATTTAAQAIAAVAAHGAAQFLVVGANETPSTGAGVVADETKTLSGGEGCLNILGVADESASTQGDLIDVLLIS